MGHMLQEEVVAEAIAAEVAAAAVPFDGDGFIRGSWDAFYDEINSGKKLGLGTRGVVKMVQRKSAIGIFANGSTSEQPKKAYALKLMKLANRNIQQGFEREARIYRQLDHPNIVHMHDAYRYQDGLKQYVALSLDLCYGGDLNEAIVTTMNPQLSGKTSGKWPLRKRLVATQQITKQVMEAVQYLHDEEQMVCHRDLKCENILLVKQLDDVADDNGGCDIEVKLVDFGEAKQLMSSDEPMTERIGSEEYMAPQVLNSEVPYTKACDLWSVGVVCLTILLANIPWDFYTQCGLKQAIAKLAHPDLAVRETASSQFAALLKSHFDALGEEASNDDKCLLDHAEELIRALLEPTEEKRVTAAQALEHAWFRKRPRSLSSRVSRLSKL